MSLYDPRNRKEVFLDAIRTRSGSGLPEPVNREEIYLKAIAEGSYKYYGAPLTAATAADMTDKNRVYVYTGSEAGYTNGNWYYWDGSAWTSGGVYNAVIVQTDTTLTQSGEAADAKAVGDAIGSVDGKIDDISIVKSNYHNYFDFSAEAMIYHTADLAVTYSGDSVLLSFTETANPICDFKIPGLFPGKTYRLKFTVSAGEINEGYCRIRRFRETDPSHATTIVDPLSFTDHVCNTTFTVPNDLYAVTLELQLRYNSKNVTLSSMSVEPETVSETRVIKESAINPDTVKMSFIYSTVTGDCTILQIQGDDGPKVMMIDCMSDNNATAKEKMREALDRGEITHLEYFMISHYHTDHIGNIQWLIDNGYIDSDTVFILPEDVDSTSAGLIRDDNPDKVVVTDCQDTLDLIDSVGCTKVYPTENEIISVNDCDFIFWNTDHSEYYARSFVDYNECSLCCTLRYGEMVVQFTGDIGPVACRKYYDKLYKCNIFKANHHACGYAVVPRFMSAVVPQIVVSMAGSSVIYSTDPSVQAAFATLSTGLQQWCEDEFVPNYVTGVIKDNIYITIDRYNFVFDAPARRCVRSDEGIPVT